nr:MAG TPA: hypothetical protein [Caudoviricetes sp.]
MALPRWTQDFLRLPASLYLLAVSRQRGRILMGFLMMPILDCNGSKPEVSIHSTLHFRQLSVDTQKARFLSIQPGMDSGKALSKITRQILMLAVLDGLIIHPDDS